MNIFEILQAEALIWNWLRKHILSKAYAAMIIP